MLRKFLKNNSGQGAKMLLSMLVLALANAPILAQDGEKILIKPPEASTQSAVGPIVKEIEIEYAGSKSVDRSVILSNMRTTIGQPYSLTSVEEDVKNLYKTGLFTNLRIYDEPIADGVKVVVIVQPKPLVKEVVVVGTKKIKQKAIRKRITSKPGDPLSEQRVASDKQEIQTYYQEKGFDKIEVNYTIDINDQIGRAVVTYTIDEGEKAFLTNISFEGNTALTEKELKKVMKLKEKNFFSWFNKSGRIKQDQLQEDLRAIRTAFQNKGYIDATVEDYKMERPKEDSIHLIITVFEGIQYSVGTIKMEGNTLFDDAKLFAVLQMPAGSIFSPESLEKDIKSMRDVYGRKGYIDTFVSPNREPNIQSGKMDLIYKINEGAQSFVEKIIIQGNNITKDKVLRRELALAPGDVYDSVRAEASQKRLENLGYFAKVDVSDQETNVPNRKNMVITVEEQRTGSITFGAGFSTVDSLLGFVELTQSNFDATKWPNFQGAGQKFRMRVQYGLQRRDALISWTEPWFLNRRLSLGFDTFYRESNFESSEYDTRRYGAAVRVGKSLNQFWRVSMRYQFENIDIFDIDDDAPLGIKGEEGERTKSSVLATLTYDTRNSFMKPSRGEKVIFSAEGAGGPLFGETDIWKLQLEASKYFELPYDMIFAMRGVTGVADAYDDTDEVPIFDRFFVGGSRSVRGFAFREVGPRFPDDEDEPSGGLTMGYANFELTFPIIDRVRGATFFDVGFNNEDSFDYDLSDFEAGTGIGLRLDLPIGPLRLDLGFPVIQREPNDGTFEFHFDVGTSF